jgi:hypothetical protein
MGKYDHIHEREPRLKEAIVIGRTFSHCGNCGRDADLHDRSHETVIGYGPHSPGCKIVYKYVTSDYSGDSIKVACQQLRPDLEWFDMYPQIDGAR